MKEKIDNLLYEIERLLFNISLEDNSDELLDILESKLESIKSNYKDVNLLVQLQLFVEYDIKYVMDYFKHKDEINPELDQSIKDKESGIEELINKLEDIQVKEIISKKYNHIKNDYLSNLEDYRLFRINSVKSLINPSDTINLTINNDIGLIKDRYLMELSMTLDDLVIYLNNLIEVKNKLKELEEDIEEEIKYLNDNNLMKEFNVIKSNYYDSIKDINDLNFKINDYITNYLNELKKFKNKINTLIEEKRYKDEYDYFIKYLKETPIYLIDFDKLIIMKKFLDKEEFRKLYYKVLYNLLKVEVFLLDGSHLFNSECLGEKLFNDEDKLEIKKLYLKDLRIYKVRLSKDRLQYYSEFSIHKLKEFLDEIGFRVDKNELLMYKDYDKNLKKIDYEEIIPIKNECGVIKIDGKYYYVKDLNNIIPLDKIDINLDDYYFRDGILLYKVKAGPGWDYSDINDSVSGFMYHDLENNIIKFVEGFKCLGNASYGYIPVSLTVNGLTRYFYLDSKTFKPVKEVDGIPHEFNNGLALIKKTKNGYNDKSYFIDTNFEVVKVFDNKKLIPSNIQDGYVIVYSYKDDNLFNSDTSSKSDNNYNLVDSALLEPHIGMVYDKDFKLIKNEVFLISKYIYNGCVPINYNDHCYYYDINYDRIIDVRTYLDEYSKDYKLYNINSRLTLVDSNDDVYTNLMDLIEGLTSIKFDKVSYKNKYFYKAVEELKDNLNSYMIILLDKFLKGEINIVVRTKNYDAFIFDADDKTNYTWIVNHLINSVVCIGEPFDNKYLSSEERIKLYLNYIKYYFEYISGRKRINGCGYNDLPKEAQYYLLEMFKILIKPINYINKNYFEEQVKVLEKKKG